MSSYDAKFNVSIIISSVTFISYVLSRFSILSDFKILLGIIIVFGLIYSIVSCFVRRNSSVDGVMIIDMTDPEKDIYRMILNDDFDTLSTKDTVTFEVHHSKILSEKDIFE